MRTVEARTVAALVVLVAQLLGASPALACTLCHSDIAQDVRAAVFGPEFWENAVALVSPVPVLLIAVLLVRKLTP